MIIPTVSITQQKETELHVFCDASELAVSAVAYLRTYDDQGKEHIGFALGKSKVAPKHGHTIPRLELCAALLGTEIAQIIQRNLSIDLKLTSYYSDSKVVLGYICNKKKRFHNYVCNRVQRILEVSNSGQWSYVPTNKNPADCGTRGLSNAKDIQEQWLNGPKTLEAKHLSI
ncbi:uncharacterized protein LOC117331220 [Pecten maximus]|uniref:uncharacterized protein LOC117331220 n=1 Tax=Pecten maximus TaxID=6579 RepID=UPI0014586983|nr:uncharacterized protein LOC117331220 [Pecten maximus]